MTDGAAADVAGLEAELARLRTEAEAHDRSARATRDVAVLLAEMSDDVTEEAAMPPILSTIAAALGATLGAYWAPAGLGLECRAAWAAPGAGVSADAWDDASHRAAIEPGAGLPGLVWDRRTPVWSGDIPALEDPRRGLLRDAEIRAGLGVPLIAGGEVLGAIELFGRGLSGGEPVLAALGAIGGHVGQLLRFARAQVQPAEDEPEDERERRTTGVYTVAHAIDDERDAILRLSDLGRTISADLDPQVVAHSVAELSLQLTGAQRSALFYRTDSTEQRYAAAGFSREELAKLASPRNTPLLGLAFNGREAVRSDDILADPRYGKNPPHQGMPAGHFPVRSYLAAPVRSRTGRISGALLLGHASPGMFDERAQRLAIGLATHAATAMDNASMFAEQTRLIEALERTNAELDQFAYAASHDLRAPLRGIANLAGWIEEDLGAIAPKKVRDHIAMLKSRTARMDRLIHGLLDLARVGRARQKPERVDVTELLHETIDLLSPPPQSRILIIGSMPTLYSERYALQQVLLNLIGNALQHAGRTDVVVRITSLEREDEVELSIADDGVGIPPELQAQCWEVFQTLKSRDVVDTPGIGLAIVKKQVEANEGRAWFVPRPKTGVDVRFTWRKRAR